jgi:hypothetical protein
MSGGLVRSVGWDGLARIVERQAVDAYNGVLTDCPWCGQGLGPDGQAPVSAAKEHGTAEALRVLAERFAANPMPWTVALLLVANPSGTDRLFADMLGVSKTKVNDARRRLREICPEIANLAAAEDNTVRSQRERRRDEGTERQAPPPLVGTIEGRVHSRFAQRCGLSPAHGVEILMDNIGEPAT